jgi:hypothetical protein
MKYSNDDSDKSIRKRNYYLGAYVFPIVVVLIIYAILFFAPIKNNFHGIDRYFGYIMFPILGFLLSQYNSRSWLQMPDGSFTNTNSLSPTQKENVDGPDKYEEEYFFSTTNSFLYLFFGIFVIGLAVIFSIRNGVSIVFLIAVAGGAGFQIYEAMNGFLSKGPQLKLAKKGLWTKKLGFINWKDIAKTQVVVTKYDKAHPLSKTILKIYLTGSIFAKANVPDEELDLTDVQNKNLVAASIENLLKTGRIK